jgi:integrase
MAKKVAKQESKELPALAKFLSKYSNKSTQAGYKNAVESFIRCINGINKASIKERKVPVPDYNTLFDKYISEVKATGASLKKEEDRTEARKARAGADFDRFATHLKESHPPLTAKQMMTFVRYTLNAHGVEVTKYTSQNIRREMKGGASTVDKVMTAKVIKAAMMHMTMPGTAIVLCSASCGSRISEILDVLIDDIEFDHKPLKMTFRDTKNKTTRYTFVSDEAREAVNEWLKPVKVIEKNEKGERVEVMRSAREQYLQTLNGRTANLIERGHAAPINGKDNRLFPMSESNFNTMWINALVKSGQFTRDSVTGRNQLRVHNFRKFYITQLSLAGKEKLGQFLSGHKGYLDSSYMRVDSTQAGEEYLQVMHVVTLGMPKEVKELENEMKKQLAEQDKQVVKTNQNMQEIMMENIEVRKQLSQTTKVLAEMQARLEAIEATAKIESEILSSLTPEQLQKLKKLLSK